MRLTSLHLENFRGLKDLKLDFHRDITVLVGVNGSGKTSVIEASAAMLGKVFGLNIGDYFRIEDCRYGQTTANIELVGYLGDPEQEFRASWGIENGQYLPGTINGFRFTSDQMRSGPLPIICYYPVNRHAVDATPGSTNPGVWTAESAWNDALDGRAASFQFFFHWFREREDLENEEKSDNPDHIDPQLEAVRKSLESLLPGYSNPRVRRPRFGPGASEVATNRPVLAFKKNGVELSFDQFSEGERSMAALVFDIARRLAIANPAGDSLEGEGIVLIDEMDLHLHPAWQANAIPALRRTFPNVQFVVTTHSPIVLGYVDSKCVRLLKDFELIETISPTEGRDPNSIYIDHFDQPLRDPSFQKPLDRIAVLIDEEKLDEARIKLDELRDSWGEQDREIVRLGTLIEMLKD